MMQVIIGAIFVIGTILAIFTVVRHMMAQYLMVRGWKKTTATVGHWNNCHVEVYYTKGNATMYLLDAFRAQRGMMNDN